MISDSVYYTRASPRDLDTPRETVAFLVIFVPLDTQQRRKSIHIQNQVVNRTTCFRNQEKDDAEELEHFLEGLKFSDQAANPMQRNKSLRTTGARLDAGSHQTQWSDQQSTLHERQDDCKAFPDWSL